jgi:hypothetical protein
MNDYFKALLNENPIYIIALIVLFIITLWVLFSTIIITYAAFKYRIEDDRILGLKKLAYNGNILIGGYLGYFAIFFFLIVEGLFFIPETWGSIDQDGEWGSTRHEIAGGIAFIISLILFINYKEVIKYLKEKIKNIFSRN